MTISKGWVFMLGVIAGIIIGLSDAGPELKIAFDNLRASASTLATTAGRGSQELGEIAAE